LRCAKRIIESTPSVRVTTAWGTGEVPNTTAVVSRTRAGGRPSAGSITGGAETPRRASRLRSRARARLNRLETVPTGHPSALAASAWVCPSSSHRTTGSRNRSGNLVSSSWTSADRSGSGSCGARAGRVSSCSVVAIATREDRSRSFRAAFTATRCSHAPTLTPRTEPAFRAKTRNVAWNASSTSASHLRTQRQAVQTASACRRTSNSNATSSRSRAKRRSSSLSGTWSPIGREEESRRRKNRRGM